MQLDSFNDLLFTAQRLDGFGIEADQPFHALEDAACTQAIPLVMDLVRFYSHQSVMNQDVRVAIVERLKCAEVTLEAKRLLLMFVHQEMTSALTQYKIDVSSTSV